MHCVLTQGRQGAGSGLTRRGTKRSMEEITDNHGPVRRFDVELFIVHPTLDPADISAALGMEAHSAHRVGDPRKTPKGTPLSGNYMTRDGGTASNAVSQSNGMLQR